MSELTRESFIQKYGQKKPQNNRKNWDEINKERKEAILKFQEGKNTLMFLIPPGASDPFTTWGFHKGLGEKDFYTVPCDAMNKGEDCVVCNTVAALKKEGNEANRHLWYPIDQKTEYWAPVINYESEETISKGPKWVRISKTIMNAFIDNFKTLEEDEYPFFDRNHPQRVIITYDKNNPPATMYSVQFKPIKEIPTDEVYEGWLTKIKPIGEYIFSRKQESLEELLQDYFTRVATELENNGEMILDTTAAEEVATAVASAESRLSSLKKKQA